MVVGILESTVSDRESAAQFIVQCVREIGAGFHPDTPFADYVFQTDGRRCFTDTEASRLDSLMVQAFEHCDPYEVALPDQLALFPSE